jgi:hypothetical protein
VWIVQALFCFTPASAVEFLTFHRMSRQICYRTKRRARVLRVHRSETPIRVRRMPQGRSCRRAVFVGIAASSLNDDTIIIEKEPVKAFIEMEKQARCDLANWHRTPG